MKALARKRGVFELLACLVTPKGLKETNFCFQTLLDIFLSERTILEIGRWGCGLYLEIRYHLGLCGPVPPRCRYHKGDGEDVDEDGDDDDDDDADDDAADGDEMNELNGQ